jgi:hypothetical protein
MFITIISVLVVVGLVLRNLLRFMKFPKSEVSISQEDLEEFNTGPPLMSNVFEAESKEMLPMKFVHNEKSDPIYKESELQKIIKHYCKKVKKAEQDLTEYQKTILEKKIHVEKMFQILQHMCENNYETVKIKKGNNSGPRAIAVKIYGTQKKHNKVRKEV